MRELPEPEAARAGGPTDLPEVFAYSDETCRSVAEQMAVSGVATLPVMDRQTGKLCGRIGLIELLAGRRRAVRRESERSRAMQPDAESDAATVSSRT